MAFYIRFYAYAIILHTQADQLLLELLIIIVHTWANQLLPQLLMEQFDTFLYNEDTLNIYMNLIGSEKIFFNKMTDVRT